MKYDVILAGVGGQGVLSVASIIAHAALSEGLNVRQSEVHGMAQRGGAVLSHLRISDKNIAGDLVPKGGADLVISMEPLESLRYVEYLKTDGVLVSNSDPFVNIGNYPDIQTITTEIKKLPSFRLVGAGELAKEAGYSKTVSTVMVGAASCFLPVKADTLKNTIADAFAKKDANVIEANKKAFNLGQTAATGKK